MQNYQILIKAINVLAFELESSGKLDTAEYFKGISKQLSGLNDKTEIKNILTQVINSGSVSQYANFSYKEDQLFDCVFDEASKLINSL